MDERGQLESLLHEFQEPTSTVSMEELLTKFSEFKKSLLTSLKMHYEDFLSESTRLADLRAQYNEIENSIRELNKEARNKVMPCITSLSSISPPEVGLSGRLTPADMHASAVSRLQNLLELNSSCSYLLNVHTILENLQSNVSSLAQKNHCLTADDRSNTQTISEDTAPKENGDLPEISYSDYSDYNIRNEVVSVVKCLSEAEALLTKKTFFEKSDVTIFQEFRRTFSLQKACVKRYLDIQWTRFIRFSEQPSALPSVPVSANQKPPKERLMKMLEVCGSSSDIEALLMLVGGLKETKSRAEKLCRDVWSSIFSPWLLSQTNTNSVEKSLRLRSSTLTGTNGVPIWQLRLVEVEKKIDLDNTQSVVNTFDELSTSLENLSSNLLCLHISEPGLVLSDITPLRLVDFFYSLDIFGDHMTSSLLNDVLLSRWPEVMMFKDNSISLSPEMCAKMKNFTTNVSVAVSNLLNTAERCGYIREKSQKNLFTQYLARLDNLMSLQLDHVYFKETVCAFASFENLVSLHKVGGAEDSPCANPPQPSSPPISAEEEAEQKKLEKILDFPLLEFPSCHVSKIVLDLLNQIDVILLDAKKIIDGDVRELCPVIVSVLRRIPLLIFLYINCVPTLHATSFKSNLEVAVTYHNDCMYLAHQCLTLGKQKIYPLIECLQKRENVETDMDSSIMLNFHSLTGLSTIQLVSGLRQAGTSTLLQRLRENVSTLVENFQLCKGLRNAAGEGASLCQQSILSCISWLLRISKQIEILPLPVYLRCLGVLSEKFVKLICQALVKLDDITTMDCVALLDLINLVISSISSLFEKHLDTAFEKSSEEKSITTLLCRRIPSWMHLLSIVKVLNASSLEKIRLLWLQKSSLSLQPKELEHLIRALYRDSNARSSLLHDIEN